MGMLPPGEEGPFHWPYSDRRKLMTVRRSSLDSFNAQWLWSNDFPIDAIGEIHVKLRTAGTPQESAIVILQVTRHMMRSDE
jgi:hypothetical protein